MPKEKSTPARADILAVHFASRENSLDAVRLFLALAVAIAHALTIKNGIGSLESVRIFDLTTSYMAVNGFFLLSGFLIAWSLSYRHDLLFFTIARALRLFPALFALALISTLVVGPIFSELPLADYVRDRDFWSYPLRVITLGRVDDGPPGLFINAPWPGEFSGSLWTLRYEAMAYAGAAIAFAFGILDNRYGPAILAALSIAAFAAVQQVYGDTLNDTPQFAILRFAVCFTLGMTAFSYGQWFILKWLYLSVFVGLFILFGHTSLREVFANLALGYAILLIGFRSEPVLAWIRKMPDMSYGIYIWHWPVYQIFLLTHPDISPWVLVFVAIPIAMVLATISWFLVEKPALGLKRAATQTIRRWLPFG